MFEQIDELMNSHLRTGSKNSRREELRKLKYFANWVLESQKRVERVENIGRRHAYEFYEYLEATERSTYKYGLAIKKLWVLVGNTGKPPIPRR